MSNHSVHRDAQRSIPTRDELKRKTNPELKEMLVGRGLRDQGVKEDFVERILEDMVRVHGVPPGPGYEGLDPQALAWKEREKERLRGQSLEALRGTLKNFDCAVSGSREDMVERLARYKWQHTRDIPGKILPTPDTIDAPPYPPPAVSPAVTVSQLKEMLGELNLGKKSEKKRALVVACSYAGTTRPLRGTMQDADQVVTLLEDLGFGQIKVLRDDAPDSDLRPTRIKILQHGFEELLRDLEGGEILFFYFSGHGGQEVDKTGREPSGYNQTIIASDMRPIKDTELDEYLVKKLKENVTLITLFDSCHSGTILNLPYNAKMENGNFIKWENEYPNEMIHDLVARGDVVQFSASRHDESAVEVSTSGGGYSGAATYAFCTALARHMKIWGRNTRATATKLLTYSEVLAGMQEALKSGKYKEQTPTLSSNRPFHPDRMSLPL